LGGEGLKERHGDLLGDARAIKEERTDGVMPVRILLQIKGIAIDGFIRILGIKAEDEGRFALAAAEARVMPRNREVRALDSREVIGMLHHEAPVDSSP